MGGKGAPRGEHQSPQKGKYFGPGPIASICRSFNSKHPPITALQEGILIGSNFIRGRFESPKSLFHGAVSDGRTRQLAPTSG